MKPGELKHSVHIKGLCGMCALGLIGISDGLINISSCKSICNVQYDFFNQQRVDLPKQ